MSGRSVILTTLFPGRLRPTPKRLTSTLCTHFRQKQTTVPLESAEGATKVCERTGCLTRDLWLLSQTRYPLRYAARRSRSKVLNTACYCRSSPTVIYNFSNDNENLAEHGIHCLPCFSIPMTS